MKKHIMVLMSTYNGEKYIVEQLESILAQRDVQADIFVRDDGSVDQTCMILEKYEKEGKLSWYAGENLGPAKSFMDLVNRAPDADYYAFADQDDVWNQDKLSIAVRMLEQFDAPDTPGLYCSNWELVDEELRPMKGAEHFSTTKFSEALVASNCTGCTVVFNAVLCLCLKKETPKVMVMHDDWAHKVCLAVGGFVCYDPCKRMKYRQHGNNADGGTYSLSHRISQILKRIYTKERVRSRQIEELYRIYGQDMPVYHRKLAERIIRYYEKNLFYRWKLAFSKEIGTASREKNWGFRMAVILKYF